jgi:hypothetical protein
MPRASRLVPRGRVQPTGTMLPGRLNLEITARVARRHRDAGVLLSRSRSWIDAS